MCVINFITDQRKSTALGGALKFVELDCIHAISYLNVDGVLMFLTREYI